MVKIKDIAIFGFKDSLVGQFINIFNIFEYYNVRYFISVEKLSDIDSNKDNFKRPNKKTEFIKNGKIYGKNIYEETEFIKKLKKDNINDVIVLEDNKFLREQIINQLFKNKIHVLSFIHESVFLGGKNNIDQGTIIFPNCYLSYKSDVGLGTIIQSNSVIEHHNVIGKYCNINPRLTTGGFTSIGDFSTIHISTTIINKIKVGNNCIIGAGALILKDCESGNLYYGCPAKKIRSV